MCTGSSVTTSCFAAVTAMRSVYSPARERKVLAFGSHPGDELVAELEAAGVIHVPMRGAEGLAALRDQRTFSWRVA
jgi:hypothetical protein